MDLKALLVDDEINILKNLQAIIPWGEVGIAEVALARNGKEALTAVEQFQPDIILCDIRMPIMDGIAFLEEVRKTNHDCEVLLLTGYQDFEYARSAIKLHVKEYILKPINYEQLQNTIKQMARTIRNNRYNKDMEKKSWGKMKNLAYEKILFDVLMDYTSVAGSYFLDTEDILFEDLTYILLLIDIDGYSRRSLDWTEKERKLWNFASRNVLQEALQEYGMTYAVVQMRQGEWCVLLEQNKQGASFDLDRAKEWAELLQNAISRNVKLAINVGVYPGLVSFADLSAAYKNVLRELHLSPDKHKVLIAGKEPFELHETNQSLWNSVEDILSGIKQSDRVKTKKALQDFNTNLMAISGQSIARVDQILHFFILHVLREMREMDVFPAKEEESIWEELRHSVSTKDLVTLINRIIDQCLEIVMSKKSGEILMLNAKDYIDRNLSSDLGIEEIADMLGISCSYFSLLFKMHFGETFVEYVTRQRMELAKSMLKMTDKSIAQISKLCGYSERRYFTKVFLKYTGMPPSEFREAAGAEAEA